MYLSDKALLFVLLGGFLVATIIGLAFKYFSLSPKTSDGSLFGKPIDWSRLMVGTSRRLWFNAILITSFQLLVLYQVATFGWKHLFVIAYIAVICLMQLKLLLALRRLYLDVDSPSAQHRAA